ncbi:unnamed protein product [Dracunculus medinensis]|uniref:Uncharacterized protein n=1 Tax=Dracunculus medinensis TaxID=318479 RepID=A0A0N4U415_DRAME|nr:unnamed protein product [Dracunculus medinensis]
MMEKGSLFLFSDLDNVENSTIHKEKCIINSDIILWNGIYAVNQFNAQKYGNHIIGELQTSFIFDEKNEAITTRNCGFIDPHRMKRDIIVDIIEEYSITDNVTKKLKIKPRN